MFPQKYTLYSKNFTHGNSISSECIATAEKNIQTHSAYSRSNSFNSKKNYSLKCHSYCPQNMLKSVQSYTRYTGKFTNTEAFSYLGISILF